MFKRISSSSDNVPVFIKKDEKATPQAKGIDLETTVIATGALVTGFILGAIVTNISEDKDKKDKTC